MSDTIRFLGQPGERGESLGGWLQRTLRDPHTTDLTVIVAWARFRGLARVQPELEAFRERGGRSRLIVGIDEGGATRPGLLMATRVFDRAQVFHDPAGGTFHPKVYLAEGPRHALLVVGSSNATPGGWYNNYEASLEARFALPEQARHPALADARRYIDQLSGESELCFELNERLVDALVRDRRYRVMGHERARDRGGTGRPDGPPPADIDASGSSHEATEEVRIFGSRSRPIATAPALSTEAERLLGELEIPPDDEAEQDAQIEPADTAKPQPPHRAGLGSDHGDGARSQDSTQPVARWQKVLPDGDAQHPAPSSHVTGNLRLTKAKQDIDWRTWFRHDLFGHATWHQVMDRRKKPIERAQIPFDVMIDGVALGTIELALTHAPHRESDQANHTTVLHWGPLQQVLRATDYSGRVLTLERSIDGGFQLTIS